MVLVVGIPLIENINKNQMCEFIELSNYKIPHSCFLEDIAPRFKIYIQLKLPSFQFMLSGKKGSHVQDFQESADPPGGVLFVPRTPPAFNRF